MPTFTIGGRPSTVIIGGPEPQQQPEVATPHPMTTRSIPTAPTTEPTTTATGMSTPTSGTASTGSSASETTSATSSPSRYLLYKMFVKTYYSLPQFQKSNDQHYRLGRSCSTNANRTITDRAIPATILRHSAERTNFCRECKYPVELP